MTNEDFISNYTIHKMRVREIVAAFDCGDDDLNGKIKHTVKRIKMADKHP